MIKTHAVCTIKSTDMKKCKAFQPRIIPLFMTKLQKKNNYDRKYPTTTDLEAPAFGQTHTECITLETIVKYQKIRY